MKTAISVPDPVFAKADAFARKLKISRSQLYARAVTEYLDKHSPDAITAALDRVCGEVEPVDEVVQAAARRLVERSEW